MRAASRFRLLADPTRLRLLRVLARDRFNVGELTAILGVAQSGVSRHLRLLKDAQLVIEERESGYVYYRLARDGPAAGTLWTLLDADFDAAADDAGVRADQARLQEVLRLRKESFAQPGEPYQLAPGRSWAAWARALGQLLPPMDVADIGCGDGYLTLEVARWARHVVGIDRSEEALDRARTLAERRRVRNVSWKKGELSRLPVRDESVDLALLSQSLRYARDPEAALAEAVRIVRPGGRLLALELKEHDQDWVRTRLGDQRLGFSRDDLQRLWSDAGLIDVRLTTGTQRAGDPFGVIVTVGTRPTEFERALPAQAPAGARW